MLIIPQTNLKITFYFRFSQIEKLLCDDWISMSLEYQLLELPNPSLPLSHSWIFKIGYLRIGYIKICTRNYCEFMNSLAHTHTSLSIPYQFHEHVYGHQFIHHIESKQYNFQSDNLLLNNQITLTRTVHYYSKDDMVCYKNFIYWQEHYFKNHIL